MFGCVPVVAWLNSIDGSRHLFFGSVRVGVWLTCFSTRVFVIGPVVPRRVGVGCLNLVIFGNFLPVQHHCVVVVLGGLFLVGFRAFHGLVSC